MKKGNYVDDDDVTNKLSGIFFCNFVLSMFRKLPYFSLVDFCKLVGLYRSLNPVALNRTWFMKILLM